MRNLLNIYRYAIRVCAITILAVSVATGTGKETEQPKETDADQTVTAEKQWPKDTKAYRRFVDFSGYRWSVKVQDKPAGPGPNFFSDRVEDIWVDDEGLHLTVSERGGKWYCTEAILQESFGYGTYIFQTKTEPEYIDANVVAGMFTWESGLPWPNRELDFEFARWSNPKDSTNAQFVVQPFTKSGNLVRYRIEPDPKEPYLTQVMTWEKDKVHFKTARGRFVSDRIPNEAVIINWTYVGSGVPKPGKENVRINLWLDEGKPPASDNSIDLVVTKFLYLPIEK